MKKSLLILSLLAIALAACTAKNDNDDIAPPKVEHPANVAGKQLINVIAVQRSYDNSFLDTDVRILCVDGVEFVSTDNGIAEHRDPNTGLPTTCSNTPLK